MKLGKMSAKKLARTLKRFFGRDVQWERSGNYAFVHLDGAGTAEMKERVTMFEPTEFFDPNCPHCEPFLKNGAIMVYLENEVIGMRLLSNGMFETVMLTGSLRSAAVAN